MLVKLCSAPGCGAFAEQGRAYCAAHARLSPAKKPFAGASRSSSPLYATARWKSLRAAHLGREPYCVACGARSSLTVDHIVPPRGDESLFFDPGNLQTLCKPCHRLKTAAEIRARKRRNLGR